MDLFQILSDIEKVDAEVYERFDTRRRVFKHLSGMGKKVTAATMPALLSTMFNKAYGQAAPALSQTIIDTLNLALGLEYLEYYYYSLGVSSGLFTGDNLNAITIIRDDERGHINALVGVLGTNAIADPTVAAFDYTAGGKLTPFASAALYLGNAQAFVDTGVRAYKGGAVNLMGNKDILTAALNIHSVEARHSSHIRTMRRGGVGVAGADNGGTNDSLPKSWISGVDGGGPAPTVTAPVYNAGASAAYPAESNVTQANVNVQTNSTAPAGLTLTTIAASEAFDEPLDAATVKTIARNFKSAVAPAYLFA